MPAIAICIPTYKRPIYLRGCIDSLLAIESIDFDIIIIDNDSNPETRKLVNSISTNIIYLTEKNKGIPFVRNNAVDYCKDKYDLLAFIDDDEIVENNWLELLLDTMNQYKADVVHGPILSKFETSIPFWASTSKFILYCPKRMETGTSLRCCSTGNVIMNTKIFSNKNNRFDSRLSNTGGSDTLFFNQIADNYTMIFCNEAIAYENVPASRQTLKWNLLRVFRNGNATALIMKIKNKNKERKKELFNWIIKLPFKLVFVPFFIILSIIFYYFLGHKIVIKLLARIYYGFGFIMGNIGFKYSEYKKIHGK